MSAPLPEKVLTTVQAAQVLGCSRQRVAILCESGELDGYQLRAGGPWSIRPSALVALQARLEAEAAARAEQARAVAARDADLGHVRRLVLSGELPVPQRIASSPRRRRNRLYRVGVGS